MARIWLPSQSPIARVARGWPSTKVKPSVLVNAKPEIAGKFNDIVAFQRSQFERSLISNFAFQSQFSETTNEIDAKNGVYAYADTTSKDLTHFFGSTASDHPFYQATKATIVARIRPFPINGNNALFGCAVSGGNPFLNGISFWADDFGSSTSNTNCLSVNFQGENRLETATGSLTAGVWSTVVISFDGPAQKVCVAVDGVTKTTLDSGSVPANLGTNSDRYSFFPNMGAVTSVGGSVSFFSVSNKYAATEAECREWSRDVYGCFLQHANQSPFLIGSTAAGGTDNLLSDDLETTTELDSPAVGQIHALLADDLDATTELDAPTIGQAHALTTTSLEALSELDSPALGTEGTDALTADDLEALSELDTPAVGQTHALTAIALEVTTELDTPSLVSVVNLTADDLEATTELGSPSLASEGIDALLANDLDAQSELDTPTLTQVHALIAADIEALVEFNSVRLDAPLTETPSSRTFVIPAQDRTIAIGAQNRTIDIPESPRC